MTSTLVFNLAAVVTLVPASLLALRAEAKRDQTFWWLTAVATVGSCAWTVVQLGSQWNAGLTGALWVIVAVTLVLFVFVAGGTREGWRLGPLLFPYLLLLGILATIWEAAPAQPFLATAPAAWLRIHILVSVTAYGLLTLASVAGLSVFMQERALKQKRRPPLAGVLPSIADGEFLQVRLLAASAAVLAVGLLSGMATEYYETGAVLRFDHKTLLSLLTFAVIVGLLAAHARTGVRGRGAARLVLLAYLLLTLAYPGVKFVADVLLGR
ncbi:MAG: cytochrome c biogenesis protein CcsA [Alphaproteobacteria bacterium]